MPAPDVDYFLDCSLLCNQIAGDTHFYFKRIHPSPNRFIDGLDQIVPRRPDDRHWDWLVNAGLACEAAFLPWWQQKAPERSLTALIGMATLPSQIEEFIAHYAGEMVDRHHTALTEAAIQSCARYRFHDNLAVMKRAAERAFQDLGGMTDQGLLDVADRMALWNQQEARRQAEQVEAMVADHDGRRGSLGPAEAFLKGSDRGARGVIKRSIRFLSNLIGAEPTRLLMGGGVLRIRSKNCLYEIVRTGSALAGHGGSRLSIYTLDGVHLCDLCLYTPGVPIADHVASIVMHIQAGDEASILTIGNAYNVCEAAYAEPWLLPHLPQRRSPEVQEILDLLDEPADAERPSKMLIAGLERPVIEHRAEKVAGLRRALEELVEAEFGSILIRDLPRPHAIRQEPVRRLEGSTTVEVEVAA